MSSRSDEYKGLWRLSAKESVLYNDDFPEPILVLPELWDGAIGQGKATRVITTFKHCEDGMWVGIVEDNGSGITNERRLKSWAASKSVDNIHRNGHGSKKALTKFMPEYETADFTLEWRGTRNPNLQRMNAPFLGDDTPIKDDEGDDTTTLMPHGTRWTFKFDPAVLKLNTADGVKSRNFREFPSLMSALTEVLLSRYDEVTLSRVEFQFQLESLTGRPFTWSSRGAHSLRWHVDAAVALGHAEKLIHHELPIEGGTRIFDHYRITVPGKNKYPLKDEFPFYGQKNMRSSRVHTALAGRMIEAIPYHRVFGREAPHNDFNGLIGFVNFVPTTTTDFEKMPQPAATKVSFWPSDPRFEAFITSLAPCIRENEARRNAEEAARRAAEDTKRRAAIAEANKAAKASKEAAAKSVKMVAVNTMTAPVALPKADVVDVAASAPTASTATKTKTKTKSPPILTIGKVQNEIVTSKPEVAVPVAIAVAAGGAGAESRAGDEASVTMNDNNIVHVTTSAGTQTFPNYDIYSLLVRKNRTLPKSDFDQLVRLISSI
jgi:hypothetical protein